MTDETKLLSTTYKVKTMFSIVVIITGISAFVSLLLLLAGQGAGIAILVMVVSTFLMGLSIAINTLIDLLVAIYLKTN
ncbi:MAG: hypothetical protein K9L74_02375 [Candidatus Izimaplasma sp.]|nr:hypothetical protein [Candidatus Izimaplasma bacterium]